MNRLKNTAKKLLTCADTRSNSTLDEFQSKIEIGFSNFSSNSSSVEIEPVSAQVSNVLAVFLNLFMRCPLLMVPICSCKRVKNISSQGGRASSFFDLLLRQHLSEKKSPFFYLSTPSLILSEHFKELHHSIFTSVPRRHLAVRVIWAQSVFLEGLLTQPRRGGGYEWIKKYR